MTVSARSPSMTLRCCLRRSLRMLLAERPGGAPVEVAGDGRAGQERAERGQVAAEPLSSRSRSSLRAAVPSTAADAHAGQQRVDAALLRPGLHQGDRALAAGARDRHAVHLVQLADQLDLDGDDGDRLGGEQDRRGEQGRGGGPLDGGHAAAGRADAGGRAAGVADEPLGERARRRGRRGGGAGSPGRGPARAGRCRRPRRPSTCTAALGLNRSPTPRARTWATSRPSSLRRWPGSTSSAVSSATVSPSASSERTVAARTPARVGATRRVGVGGCRSAWLMSPSPGAPAIRRRRSPRSSQAGPRTGRMPKRRRRPRPGRRRRFSSRSGAFAADQVAVALVQPAGCGGGPGSSASSGTRPPASAAP